MKRRGIKMQMIKNAKFLERIRKSVNNTTKRKEIKDKIKRPIFDQVYLPCLFNVFLAGKYLRKKGGWKNGAPVR